MTFNIIFVVVFLIVGVTIAILTNSEERLKKAREKAIAEELEIEVKDFGVLTFVKRDKFLGEIDGFNEGRVRSLSSYYSGQNSVWLIQTKDYPYQIFFKGNTDHVIYVKKLEGV
ncbi:hypothetical protein [Carnobacterium divergens]|uniref:hypothetical protein n=1 Tax=Carnobacterium divergens TaxID=2748 RepID=UPI00288CADA9|nr:hypothetical protein [Carnobacterium divergens]MDT2010818.1 hypothetical protein [Carnobacterium divergens]